MRLTNHEWNLAQQACTPKQLQALDYWRHGYGYKRISLILGLRRDTVRGRIDRGLETIHAALVSSTPPEYHHRQRSRVTSETRTHPPRP